MFLIQIPLTVIITLLGKEKGKNKNCRITEASGAEVGYLLNNEFLLISQHPAIDHSVICSISLSCIIFF